MADHSVAARDESHESEASWALMFCFDNVSPEKTCFAVNLVCFISLWLRVAVFLNAARKDINVFKYSLRVLSFYVRYEWPTERFKLKMKERLVNDQGLVLLACC